MTAIAAITPVDKPPPCEADEESLEIEGFGFPEPPSGPPVLGTEPSWFEPETEVDPGEAAPVGEPSL